LRHAYRFAASSDPGDLPSPFVPGEAEDYERWRRSARRLTGRLLLSDVAKAVRMSLPEEYERLRRRMPGVAKRLRGRVIERSGWRY
jgi:hypothetical protein